MPSARTSTASAPRAVRQADPSVISAPIATGVPPARRMSASAAVIEAPVDTMSSTTTTRRPRTEGTLAGSIRSIWRLSVVIERTGSA